MKMIIRKALMIACSAVLVLPLLITPVSAQAGTAVTHTPAEKTAGLVKNPGMGWVLYCDAFGQMTNPNIPDYNKCVMNPSLFWQTFDNAGATAKASIFYLRAPWSFFESAEGQFAWDQDANYRALIQGAQDRG